MKNLITSTIFFLLFTTASLVAQNAYGTLYHPEADAEADISRLMDQAREEGKHLLIQVGGNWCVWCYRFEDFINSDEGLKDLRSKNYITYHLNYSQEQKNEALLAQYRHPERFGFPVLLVLDARGNLLHTQDTGLLEDGEKSYNLRNVTTFFKAWSPEAFDPATYEK